MDASVKIETLMWLLPIAFMIHDFEEIIMIPPWINHYTPHLRQRFPRLASSLLPYFENLSTSSFALAVAEEFILLTMVTYLTVERELYAVWAGILLGFFVHLIVHWVQFAIYRGYTPAIITSALSSIYCLGALYSLGRLTPLLWTDVAFWTFVAVMVIVLNLILAHMLAARFERYIRRALAPQ